MAAAAAIGMSGSPCNELFAAPHFGPRAQSTSDALMVPPHTAMFDGDAAAHAAALEEFSKAVAALRENGVRVHVCPSSTETASQPQGGSGDESDSDSDSGSDEPIFEVFPSCWFSTHEGGILCVYSMEDPLRRLQRTPETMSLLKRRYRELINFQRFESQDEFLESSDLALDRLNKVSIREKKILSQCSHLCILFFLPC
jgi:hypothetical protein